MNTPQPANTLVRQWEERWWTALAPAAEKSFIAGYNDRRQYAAMLFGRKRTKRMKVEAHA